MPVPKQLLVLALLSSLALHLNNESLFILVSNSSCTDEAGPAEMGVLGVL